MNTPKILATSLCLLALAVLTGCGAAKSYINNQIDPIANPGNLEGKQFPVPVSKTAQTKAAIPGAGNYQGTFNDVGKVRNQNLLTFTEVYQRLKPEIQVVLPPGVSYPAQVSLSGLALRLRFYEAASIDATATREVVFPDLKGPGTTLTFAQIPNTNRYTLNTTSEIQLGKSKLSGDPAKRLFNLLTETDSAGSKANFIRASVVVTADDTQLPEGSIILFTFGYGQAEVGL